MPPGEEILWLRSLRTGRHFPTVLFSADTDMATAGRLALTGLNRDEVVIAEFTAEELALPEPACWKAVEWRLNAALGRTDLRSAWITRVQDPAPPRARWGFRLRGSLARSRPPEVFYRDIFGDGEAVVATRQSIAEFQAAGGVVTRVPAT